MVTFTEPFRANFRVTLLLGFPQGKLRREAVVATDTVSVNADCDNGAGLRGSPRSRGAVETRLIT
jgi:hypothetical protein